MNEKFYTVEKERTNYFNCEDLSYVEIVSLGMAALYEVYDNEAPSYIDHEQWFVWEN